MQAAERLDKQFRENQDAITNIQQQLLQKLASLPTTTKQEKDLRDFINDRVNIFRFLKETRFDVQATYERMSETVEWRRDVNMADLSFRDCPEFVQNEFAYISTATDITHRPVVFLKLQNFPLPPKKRALADHIQPFACLLMEAARKLTYDISKKLEQEGRDIQLVSQVTIVVNIAKAPLIPIDSKFMKAMGEILGKHFPGFVGTIYAMNFGWIYQGAWSVIKLLLSDRAKSKIQFCSAKELSSVIDTQHIPKALGGQNDYVWSVESDSILQKYAVGSIHKEEEKEIDDDDDDDRSDVYYDAPDTLVPISIPVPISARTLTLSAPSSNKQIIEKKSKSRQWIKSLLKVLLKGKGAYWVMLYLLLRGPVETIVHKLVAKTRFIQSQRLQATTIGITAIIAATASNSLASLLQK